MEAQRAIIQAGDEGTWTVMARVGTEGKVLWEMGLIGLGRGYASLVQSSLCSQTEFSFCKVNYHAHFTNKKVPRSGLHWVVAFRPSQKRGAGFQERQAGPLNQYCTGVVFLGEAFVFKGVILRTTVSVGISPLCTAEPSLRLRFLVQHMAVFIMNAFFYGVIRVTLNLFYN